ncbi:ribosomal-processing cysteine protease Prp [Paradesulfitobacterium ferrireducens]|uniref:ribosomal-processing cysteine protease Prp n=1 Tax=Paradesulfitobacterium ferrireducens TaxID=2816476 RepID=UPI001A8D3AA0|nr:ribosomal-processing cysteine protease Prp [Paradesulfitobacterium ferrireducens]
MTLWLDQEDRVREFEFSGHAGYGAYGEDIVCAAVSALSIAAANGLEHYLSRLPQVEGEDGYVRCVLPELSEPELNQAQWILHTMSQAVEEIQQTYGDRYLIIERRRWTPC